ncbi:MAG: hypothetical protein V3U82_04350, partial [Robiginitomaculum sp.]
MSTMKTILRSTTFVATSAAALALTACASQAQDARYGNVYDYESGSQCQSQSRYNDGGQGCNGAATQNTQTTRYGDAATNGVVYADCSVMNNMGCAPAQTQTYPAQTYPVAQTYPATTYPAPAPYQEPVSYGGYSTGEAVACPAGTTASNDGSCLQSSGGYSDSYSSGSYGATTS